MKLTALNKVVLLISLSAFYFGCATIPTTVNIKCPNPPKMRKVVVKDGTLKGKDLEDAIKNHEDLWKHIHRLHKLGCKKSK